MDLAGSSFFIQVITGDKYTALCPDNYTWRSPSCRLGFRFLGWQNQSNERRLGLSRLGVHRCSGGAPEMTHSLSASVECQCRGILPESASCISLVATDGISYQALLASLPLAFEVLEGLFLPFLTFTDAALAIERRNGSFQRFQVAFWEATPLSFLSKS